MTEERKPRSRFYDGTVYSWVLDPMLSKLHSYIAKQIEPGTRVLDAGCGTGSLALRVAANAREVVGVELSPAMVAAAKKRAERASVANVSFVLGDVTAALRHEADGSFDIATAVMMVHELPTATRTPVLQELGRVARRVLCLDFRAAMPWGIAGARSRMAELLAGAEHFAAFVDFRKRGGLPGVAAAAGLACAHVRFIDGGTMEVCFLQRRAQESE